MTAEPRLSSHNHVDAKTSLRAILASNPSISPISTSTSTILDSSSTSIPSISASFVASKSTNQSSSQKELENLGSGIKVLNKQSTQAEKLVQKTTEKLKEFGDLQTWAEVVWREIYVLEEVFTLGDEVPAEGDGSRRC